VLKPLGRECSSSSRGAGGNDGGERHVLPGLLLYGAGLAVVLTVNDP
jgi:hypothetical protein